MVYKVSSAEEETAKWYPGWNTLRMASLSIVSKNPPLAKTSYVLCVNCVGSF